MVVWRLLGVVIVIFGFAAAADADGDAMAVATTANGGEGSHRFIRIVGVIDGDTLKIATVNGVENARFKFIDTPELRGKCEREQQLAIRARDRLEQLIIAANRLRISFHGRGYYGRPLITLRADGADVGAALISEGLARPYKPGRESWCEKGE